MDLESCRSFAVPLEGRAAQSAADALMEALEEWAQEHGDGSDVWSMRELGSSQSARQHAPQAIIAIDPFHVAKAGSGVLDEVRRAYWNELRQSGDEDAARRFKDARWALLKRPENLTEGQATTVARLRACGGEAWRAHTLKETLRAIFAPGLSVDDVALLLDRFINRSRRLPHPDAALALIIIACGPITLFSLPHELHLR